LTCGPPLLELQRFTELISPTEKSSLMYRIFLTFAANFALAATGAAQVKGVQEFTTTTLWKAKAPYVLVEMWGAGGGGGGSLTNLGMPWMSTSGGGGGGGGYYRGYVRVRPNRLYTITVGQGGIAGLSGITPDIVTSGTAGGHTSIMDATSNTLVIAQGGDGGGPSGFAGGGTGGAGGSAAGPLPAIVRQGNAGGVGSIMMIPTPAGGGASARGSYDPTPNGTLGRGGDSGSNGGVNGTQGAVVLTW